MQAKKYQIFVSSTYSDLIEERREVIETIIDLGHIPAGMEGFPAIDIEQFKYITRVIDQCDYYVLILAGRYGSLASDGMSFTEKEYRYAVESGKIVIAFVLDSTALASLPAKNVDTDSGVVAKLETLKADVMNGRLVRLWRDRNSLSKAVMKSLVVAFEEFPGEGWVRGSVQAKEDVLAQINELRLRNEALESMNERLRAQLEPKLENLASLEASYLIKYSYFDARHGHRVESSVSLPWRKIFIGMAPKLAVAQTPTAAISHLQKYLDASGSTKGRTPHINSICADQIVVQLAAYGLISRFTAKSTAGAMRDWIQITEAGNRLMMEEMVVTSGQNSTLE